MVDDRIIRFVELRSQMCFCHGHADGHGNALPQRAGGSVNAGRMTDFWMSGRQAAPLAELGKFFDGDCIAKDVQQGIGKHAAVSGRENETVPVIPTGAGGVMFHLFRIERVRHGCGIQYDTGMATLGLLNGVDAKNADGVDTKGVFGIHDACLLYTSNR